MPSVHIRRQGGAAIMTIPAELLRQLDLAVGESVELEVADGALVVRPTQRQARRRYALGELLEGVTPALARQMAKDSAPWHRGAAVGRELT